MPHDISRLFGNLPHGYCERCHKKTDTFRMSMFNTQNICTECVEKEQSHPLYAKAVQTERDEYLKGNRNFEGIGLPADL